MLLNPHAIAAALLAALLAFSFEARAADTRPVVTVVNWEEWVSPQALQAFEKKENVRVNVLTYTSVEEADRLLSANAGKVDIVVGSSLLVRQFKEQRTLQKLDRTKLTNLRHMLPRFTVDPDYAVPYLWGYTGILYRKDLVKTPPRTYAQLLALAREQPGKVSLMTDPVEYAWGVLWGIDGASAKPDDLASVQAALATFRRDYAGKVRLFDVDYDAKNPIATGAIVAAQAYSDYASVLALEQKLPVAFVNPDDVCILWMDSLMLLANAPQPALATRLINHLSDARVAARNAMDVKSTSANPLSVQYYTDAYRNNPVARPSFEGTERCRIHDAPTPAARKFYDSLQPAGIR